MLGHLRTAAVSLALGLAATTTGAGAMDIVNACRADIEQYCSAVEPGYGRLASCLYAHELVISDECDAATADVADILDTMFASMRVVIEECSTDILKLCEGVAPGEGRIFTCLATNRAELSEGCGEIMSVVKLPGQQ